MCRDMNHNKKSFGKTFLPLYLAFSISLSSTASVLAAPGDTNSRNVGRDILSGTYYNTPGGKTVFRNSGPSGLWLRQNDIVRALEVKAGVPTGNGGTVHFRAPNSVVRLDGTVDASAIHNGTMYLGNGGKVFIDAT